MIKSECGLFEMLQCVVICSIIGTAYVLQSVLYCRFN